MKRINKTLYAIASFFSPPYDETKASASRDIFSNEYYKCSLSPSFRSHQNRRRACEGESALTPICLPLDAGSYGGAKAREAMLVLVGEVRRGMRCPAFGTTWEGVEAPLNHLDWKLKTKVRWPSRGVSWIQFESENRFRASASNRTESDCSTLNTGPVKFIGDGCRCLLQGAANTFKSHIPFPRQLKCSTQPAQQK